MMSVRVSRSNRQDEPIPLIDCKSFSQDGKSSVKIPE